MHYSAWIWLLAAGLMMLSVLMGGCSTAPETTSIRPVTRPAPPLGTFNLHRRHGLGGWNRVPSGSPDSLPADLSRQEAW